MRNVRDNNDLYFVGSSLPCKALPQVEHCRSTSLNTGAVDECKLLQL